MNIRPFSYGMKVKQMYDRSGEVLSAETCSISPNDILANFNVGV